MSYSDFSILLIAIIISVSGILINIFRRNRNTPTLLTQDGQTLFLFRTLVPLALVSSLLIYFSPWGNLHFHPFFIYLGYFLVLTGLLIRWIAVISLGQSFTVEVSIVKNQQLKTDGIYKKIRHPSYTGLLLYYLGLGLVMHNIYCLFLLSLAPLIAVLYRIKQEEKVLLDHFEKDYVVYKILTWKIIPWVY